MLKSTEINYRLIVLKLSVFLCVFCVQHNNAIGQSDIESNVRIISTSDYSLGVQAYLNGQFEKAQIHWLNAVKQNDARSMFNLGLLHEQGKISDANIEKAENWYRLAGKHGYPPADFHLAKLKMTSQSPTQENNDVVMDLLRTSAENGYDPARVLLTQLSSNAPLPLVNNDTTIDTKQTSSNEYLSEDWIAQKTSSNWTIQILAFEEKAKVHQFIDRHQLNETASYFAERSQDTVLYKLIYGSYQTKQEAENARDNLSDELKQYGPWLRTIASVQSLLD